jgi:hypothetical protein
MEKELAVGEISPEAKYVIEFKNGELEAHVEYQGKFAGASVKVSLPAEAIIDAIKAAIPGKVDDVILDIIKNAVKVA